ncbi:hypothetical protein BC940DRAFT_326794 [Gongronella butleri]|nr:hypothetical protein BC940DRAFT_326794 [Gongronella butleri]
MEKKRKRPGSVYEERLDTIKQNAKRRSNVLKHLDAPARNSAGQQQEIDQAIFSQQGEQTCFVCNQVLFGDSDAINAHIDHCLENMNDPSSSFARQTTTPQSQPSLETASPAPQPGAWDVYEWDGEVRVRASAMMEGGYRGAGFATTKKEEDVDIDEDLDIEDDDNAYGQAQYTEQDIHIDDDDDDDAELSIDDDGDMPGASSSTSAPNPYPPTGNLVMDALRARIHQLEMATKSVQRCLICLEPYTKPVASVVCWHVHCEKCWMQTLSSKKLCPQCQKITAPADLRRVYL